MINKLISMALAVLIVSGIVALIFVIIPVLSFLFLCIFIGTLLLGVIWFFYMAIKDELEDGEGD